MISRCITSLLLVLLTTAPVFFFGMPAHAHGLDYCLEILQETANRTVNSTEKFKLQKYPEYAEIAKGCDKELKSEGLVTLAQVSKYRNIASSVLNGLIAVEDYGLTAVEDLNQSFSQSASQSARRKKENEVKQKEENLKKIRANICGRKAEIDRFACPD